MKLEKILDRFYKETNKPKLAREVMDAYQLDKSDLIDFDYLESEIKRKLTIGEKDKLKILYNSLPDDSSIFDELLGDTLDGIFHFFLKK